MDEKRVLNELKVLALEMINNAGSGHSGSVLSCTDALYVLYTKHLLTDGTKNMLRDRFVLSNGHVCAGLYAVLAGMGYIEFDKIKNFRKVNSELAGHPEIAVDAIDCSTGPLGQGVANAVGMAIAETVFREKFGEGHFTYCMAGDGCLQEGVALEALSVAGLYGLNKLILFYDKNDVTLDGELKSSSNDDVVNKFKSMNFNVFECDGYNLDKIDKAIIKAKKSKDKPTVIVLKTVIAKDTSLEGKNTSHGAVFEIEEINKLKNKYEIDNEYLILNEETKKYLENKKLENIFKFNKKCEKFNEKLEKNQNLLKKYNNLCNLNKKFKIEKIKEKLSTREINNKILNAFAKENENLIVLSADLSSSTKVKINDGGNYSKQNPLGKNLAVGIREHAMGAIANGIALHGSLIPITSTFLAFSNYMLPPMRMACIMNLPVIFTFSHSCAYDSADGITHVPVEQLDQLRLMPNLAVFRPCCAEEIQDSYNWLIDSRKPMCLCISKTKTDTIKLEEKTEFGFNYISKSKSKINLISSGTECELALKVAEILREKQVDVNVLSVNSLEIVEKQPKAILNKLFTENTFVVESGTCYKYLKFVEDNHIFKTRELGISGSAEDVKKHFGFDVNKIAKEIFKMLK